jgi:hypothetical protein
MCLISQPFLRTMSGASAQQHYEQSQQQAMSHTTCASRHDVQGSNHNEEEEDEDDDEDDSKSVERSNAVGMSREPRAGVGGGETTGTPQERRFKHRVQVSRVMWVRAREGVSVGVSMNASVVERMCVCRVFFFESSEVGEGVSVAVVTWGPRSVCERERASWAFVNVGPAADED